MGGNTRFEGPGSERDTVSYRTYDERAVGRDEIDYALHMDDGGGWPRAKVIVVSLGALLIAVAVAVILLTHA